MKDSKEAFDIPFVHAMDRISELNQYLSNYLSDPEPITRKVPQVMSGSGLGQSSYEADPNQRSVKFSDGLQSYSLGQPPSDELSCESRGSILNTISKSKPNFRAKNSLVSSQKPRQISEQVESEDPLEVSEVLNPLAVLRDQERKKQEEEIGQLLQKVMRQNVAIKELEAEYERLIKSNGS